MEKGVRVWGPGCYPSSGLLFFICEMDLSFLTCEMGLTMPAGYLAELLPRRMQQDELL